MIVKKSKYKLTMGKYIKTFSNHTDYEDYYHSIDS